MQTKKALMTLFAVIAGLASSSAMATPHLNIYRSQTAESCSALAAELKGTEVFFELDTPGLLLGPCYILLY